MSPFGETEDEFPGRTQGLISNIALRIGGSIRFRAGSYGGYSVWRDWLAKVAGFADAQKGWDDEPEEGPFIELINFSDCEGIIGPVVAKKLAQDFADFETKALEMSGDDAADWNMKLYRQWRNAFEMAANNGAVAFH